MTGIEAVVARQLSVWSGKSGGESPKPVITISRQRGSGGSFIARRLTEELDYNFFDKNLLDALTSSDELYNSLMACLPEEERGRIDEWASGPDSIEVGSKAAYFKKLHHAVAAMGRLGGAVLLGRGCNFILTLRTGFHVRIIANEPVRVKKLAQFGGVAEDRSLEACRESDDHRRAYIKEFFGYDIDDRSYYDLVFNRSFFDTDAAVSVIKNAALAKTDNLDL